MKLFAGLVIAILALCTAVNCCSLQKEEKLKNDPLRVIPDREKNLPPSKSELQHFNKHVVCADSTKCSKVGSDILAKGGNVIDSAIATMFCNGMIDAESMGIGGGFIMNIYKDKKFYTLNAKEVASEAATPNMFKTQKEYEIGAGSIGVPGEVKGYWELYKRFGSMPWKSLVEPAIKICEKGMILSGYTQKCLEPHHYKDKHLRKTFFRAKNKPRNPGDLVKFVPELCNTYKMIAEKGGDDFYNGTLADLIAADLKDIGSIITKKDLQSYEPRWEETLSVPMIKGNLTAHLPPSAGGPVVGLILNILRGYNISRELIRTENELVQTYHRFIEASKFAFGYRTHLHDSDTVLPLVRKMLTPAFGDEIRALIDDNKTWTDPKHYGGEFVINDKGTSHTSILAANGDAVSVTSSLNFLALTQPSANNFIAPKKRATSSFSPIIVTDDKGGVRMVVGGAGGTRIITAVSMVIGRVLWFNENLKEAIDASRMHHQLLPMQVDYQYGIPAPIISGLKALGHKMERNWCGISNVRAIARNESGIFANADYRKEGKAVGE
ncbi:glutathione hydrolase 1 proenzyme-like isoform X2 [Contarinia nasturtii]|uniref:glutathione hydrolase 1 proenzyme-like isoform X2 n=1 Tax=Contarinia nasturtii TaxID=265458 RepID=UPI0012D4BFDC|nr:glutathione hydrolase 1 proenzyme-like isoform X2 [Contarinia nasturtii]